MDQDPHTELSHLTSPSAEYLMQVSCIYFDRLWIPMQFPLKLIGNKGKVVTSEQELERARSVCQGLLKCQLAHIKILHFLLEFILK